MFNVTKLNDTCFFPLVAVRDTRVSDVTREQSVSRELNLYTMQFELQTNRERGKIVKRKGHFQLTLRNFDWNRLRHATKLIYARPTLTTRFVCDRLVTNPKVELQFHG